MGLQLVGQQVRPWRMALAVGLAIGVIQFATWWLIKNYFGLGESSVEVFTVCLIVSFSAIAVYFPIVNKTTHSMSNFTSAVCETMNEGLVVHDHMGRVVGFNPSALRILGLTEEQLMGGLDSDSNWKSFRIDGSEIPTDERPTVRVRTTGIPQTNYVMGVTSPSGVEKWFSINAMPLRYGRTGRDIHVLTTFLDITEQIDTQKRAQRERDRLQAAIEAVRFGVWEWSIQDGILQWDDSMHELFEMPRDEFKHDYTSFEERLIPEDRDPLRNELNAAFARGDAIFRAEFRIRSQQSGVKYIAVAAKCYYGANGQIERLVGNNWDITAAKKTEIALINSSKMAALGEMSGGIAHEINNPLAIISGRASLMLREIDKGQSSPVSARVHLQKIIQTAHRIAKIISGLRSFARDVENEPLQISTIKTIVSETVELCMQRFQGHGVSLEVGEIPHIEIACRSVQLSQVLLNLLNNSFDAVVHRPEKWIRIECSWNGTTSCVLAVTDSGPGIDPSIVDKMMRPFFTTKPVGHGTGLGLSISRGIIEDHGGYLNYDENCRNTRFTVTLPTNQVRKAIA